MIGEREFHKRITQFLEVQLHYVFFFKNNHTRETGNFREMAENFQENSWFGALHFFFLKNEYV